VFLLAIQKKIREQPCSNGEPIRHTVLWEGIRTTHKLPGSPMGHVPMGTTDAERCVERIQCVRSPPPSSSHYRDRTRTLISWVPRHIVTPLSSRTPNENRKSTNITSLSSSCWEDVGRVGIQRKSSWLSHRPVK
jgi:hypothetical protein